MIDFAHLKIIKDLISKKKNNVNVFLVVLIA